MPKVEIDWELEYKRMEGYLKDKNQELVNAKTENEQLKCELVNEKNTLEAKLRDAEQAIQIFRSNQQEDKAKINELSVYKRIYEDIFARR